MEGTVMTTSYSPATGVEIGTSTEHSPEDVRDGVERSRVAQRTWAGLSLRERARHIRKIRDFLVEHADRIAEVISLDNGKTRVDALSTEVLACAMAADFYATHTGKVLAKRRVSGGNILLINKRSYIERVPFGVVGIISPWNYPFSIPFHEIAMGLMAGNGIILKGASQTQEVSKMLVECIDAGDLPEHLFSVFNLTGEIAGDAFIDAGIDKLFFTGSVLVGQELMAKAAHRLIPVSLELGGNDAMIVCADANAYRAAAGAAWAGFSNAGQSCGGVERVFVEDGIYDEFIGHLRTITRALRFGPDKDFGVDVGAITTRKQLETIHAHTQDALANGATIGAVSQHPKEIAGGQFFPPTVLEDVTEEMITMREETFGPVVAVMRVESIDEAIRHANTSSLGLTASVWSRDRSEARRIASQLKVGTVTINDHLMSHGLAETPWGGFKKSGIGRTHGELGLEEMTQPRCIVDDIMPGVQRNMWWYPHGKGVYDGLKAAMVLLYGKTIVSRIKSIPPLVRLFLRSFHGKW